MNLLQRTKSKIINSITSKIAKGLGLTAIAAATLAMSYGGTSLSAQAAETECPTGWTYTVGTSNLKPFVGGAAFEVMAKEDQNGNHNLCAKVVQGKGSTGYGANGKDDRVVDVTETFISVPESVLVEGGLL